MLRTLLIYVIGGLIILLTTGLLQAQDPVDCVNAIPVCNSLQLNYNSNGPGVNDFGPGPNNFSNGCLLGDEHQSAWFQIYISPSSPPGATLAFTLTPTAGMGEDYDFALYGPNADCSGLGDPIRCSFAGSGCFFCPETGLGMGTDDFSEGAGGDGFVAEVVTQPGESYILLVDNWLSSSQGFFLDWTGTAVLSCECTASATITGDLEVCPGETTELTATGTDLVDFQWEATGGGSITGPANTATITAGTPGTYTVTVTDNDDCTGTASVVVTEAPGPVIDSSVQPATCGQSNGSIDLMISGGASPYSFEWSNGETTEDITDLATGDFTVTVTSADGCTSTATFQVPEDNPPLNITGIIEDNTSCLTGNGSILTTVFPGGSYTYEWSNGVATADLFDLGAGTYVVTVTSTGTCTGTASFTILNDPDEPEVTGDEVSSVCDLANGEIDVTVTGGVPPYVFEWSGGETTEDLLNISAGSYALTVTGDNGCTDVINIVVGNDNPPIDVSAVIDPNTSCNDQNGAITITLDPPTSPSGESYTFSWSNGSTNQDLMDLAAGTYTLTVSGGGSCTEEVSFTVPDEPDIPELEATITPENCGQANGAIQTNINGGVLPFSYLWSDGSSGPDINNLPAGNYTITVTGDNGCTAEETFTVPDEPITFTVNATIDPNTTCTGSGNGSISVTVVPGGSYTFTWSNGETGTLITDLDPGNYSLTVSAGGTCEEVLSFTVPDEPDLPVIDADIVPAMCGEPVGSVTIIPTGGASPFTYLWSNGETTQTIQDLLPGSYTVTVTGANACETIETITVPNEVVDFVIIQDITPNTSCLAGNGSIGLTITPGSGITFEWSNGEATEDISGLSAGVYTLTVSAGGTCEEVFDFNVPDDITVPVINLTTTAATCGRENGSIDLTMNAGEAPFDFSWSNGEFTGDLQDVFPGIYTVTVMDNLGCTATATAQVNNNTIPLDISGFAVPNSSCDAPNGEINISVEPAGEDYDFLWSNGETFEDLTDLEPGTYTVTATLGDICDEIATFTVGDETSAPEVTADVTAAVCGEDNGAIDLTVTGSEPPYTFLWSNGETFEDITDLFPGSYFVTVTGSNDCSTVIPVNVPNNSSNFSISGMVLPLTSCDQDNGAIDVTVDPPGSYSFEWSNEATTEDLDNLTPGDYTVTVIQAGSCTASATFTVTDETASPSYAASIGNDLCSLSMGSIELTELMGEPPFEIIWSNGVNTALNDGLLAGNYSVTVTDNNGCSATSSHVIVSNSMDISVTGTSLPNTSCANPNGSIDIAISPVDTYSFLWSNGQMTEDLTNVASGNYSVTVSLGSCFTIATFNVGADASAVSLGGLASDVSCNGGTDGSIQLDLSGGVPPYMLTWSPDITGSPEDPLDLSAGEYAVTVTDQAGCSTTSSFTVGEPEPIALNCSQTASVSAPGESDGTASIQVEGGTPPYSITWTPENSQDNVQPGTFNVGGLSEGEFLVEVTDASGCISMCSFTIIAEECNTTVGILNNQPVFSCGEGCITAMYDDAGQVLGPDDILQFIVYEGTPGQIQNELGRFDEPEFCFDPATMQLNTQYYIMAIAGPDDGSGNVLMSGPCVQTTPGTAVMFNEIPVATIDDPGQIDCDNPELEITGRSSVAASTFQWLTEEGNILSDPKQPTITVNQGGFYELIVSASDCRDTSGINVAQSDDYPDLTIGPVGTLDCINNEVTLSGQSSQNGVDLMWATIAGADTSFIGTGDSLTIDTPGTYYLLGIADNGCTSAEAVTVNQFINTPTVTAGDDVILDCNQTTQQITAVASDGVEYLWIAPPGVELPVINIAELTVDQPGLYIVQVTDTSSLCTATDTIEVIVSDETPVSVVSAENVSCFGESDGFISVEPEQGQAPFTFFINGTNNGADNSFTSLDPGIYTIEVVDDGNCSWVTDVEITEPELLNVDLGADISVSAGEIVTLEVQTNLDESQIGEVLWNPQNLIDCINEPCTQVSFTSVASTEIEVTLIDTNGCLATDALSLVVIADHDIFIPNVFSPNGDGRNDIFTLYGGDGVRSIRHLSIFSRWGELIFQKEGLAPNNPVEGWDGTINGTQINPGVYLWKAEIEYDNGGVEVMYGDVTLVR